MTQIVQEQDALSNYKVEQMSQPRIAKYWTFMREYMIQTKHQMRKEMKN